MHLESPGSKTELGNSGLLVFPKENRVERVLASSSMFLSKKPGKSTMMRDMAFGNKRHTSSELMSGGFMRTYKAGGVDLSELRRIQIESEALRKKEIEDRRTRRDARRTNKREIPKSRHQKESSKKAEITEGSPSASSIKVSTSPPHKTIVRSERKPHLSDETAELNVLAHENTAKSAKKGLLSPEPRSYPFLQEFQQLHCVIERFTSPYCESVSEDDKKVFAEFLSGDYECSDKRVCIVLHSGGINGEDGKKREDTFVELDYKNNMWRRITKLFPMV